MSETYREQRPLLSGEFSDEDSYSPHFSRTSHIIRGRNRSRFKGAAAILAHWPDHWTTFLAYWWIGIGMVCLTTFIIYNSLFIFPMIETVKSKPALERIFPVETTPNSHFSRDVYMHLFVNQDQEVNFNEYMPYIEKISNKYSAFDFHFVILLNVTNMKDLTAKENNDMALNSLWDDDSSKIKEPIKRSNVNIEYVSLTTYMDNSPLNKFWRTMSPQHVQFLARAVSIWNKGGIAFNPEILTPRSAHVVYEEKLRKLLNKFKGIQHKVDDLSKESLNTQKSSFNPQGNKKIKNVNNILDIINALESQDDSTTVVSQELAEAENKHLPVITRDKRENYNITDGTQRNRNISSSTTYNNTNQIKESYPYLNLFLKKGNATIGTNLLSSFVKLLFNYKTKNKTVSTEPATFNNRSRVPKSVIDRPKQNKNNSLLKDMDKYGPVIVSAKAIKSNISTSSDDGKDLRSGEEVDESMDSNRLTIDLRGNIIATDTSCHAFLGTIFSNAPHHSIDESVTDYIIAELTNFCKGLLSSCMGIDVILL